MLLSLTAFRTALVKYFKYMLLIIVIDNLITYDESKAYYRYHLQNNGYWKFEGLTVEGGASNMY